MDKLISCVMLAVVLLSNVEGYKKTTQGKNRQEANTKSRCVTHKGRLCIEKFQLDVHSTNGLVIHDLIGNTTVDLDGLNISMLNFTCSARGSAISRIAIKRHGKMLNETKYADSNITCTRIEYITKETKRGRYYCEVEKSYYKTVRASVRLRLKSIAMTTEKENCVVNLKTITVTEITTTTNIMINSTESKLKAGTLDTNFKNTTESSVYYIVLGFLLFATISTVVVAFRYRKKYRRYRHNFITVSRRLAQLNEKSRHRNVQTVEDAYTNSNCKAAKTGVHIQPPRREVEQLYVNSILPPVETDRYLSNEGLIYISLSSQPDLIKTGRSRRIRNTKGKISYSTIDYDKTGKVTIVSNVDNEDENENKIYQNCLPIVRRII